MHVWLNGEYKNADDAVVAVTDRGFLLGDGFFETMRAHRGVVAWLPAHMERLAKHADMVGLPANLLPAQADVTAIVAKLCAQADLSSAVVRISVSRGSGPRGLLPPETPTPTVLITVAPFAPAATSDGLRLITAQKIRRNPWSVAGTIKSLNYLDNIVAKQEADQAGCDDALILSVDGSVAETTIANLFGIKDGVLWTPDAATGILCGLARTFVINLARANRVDVGFEAKSPDELGDMDFLFTVNALQGLRRVATLDGKPIGDPSETHTLFARIAHMVDANLCDGM